MRGRKSGTRYKDTLEGKTARYTRFTHIRNRSTMHEALVADFIEHNDGAFLEIEF